MKIYFTKVEGKSTGLYLLLGILGILALGGLYSSYLMYTKGHYLTGMNNQVPWGLPIVITIYLIGLSAGSLVLSSLSTVFGQTEYKGFSRVAVYLAALLLVGALLSLSLDLGRPERMTMAFFYLNPTSIFSWNGFLYSTYILICIVYLWAMFTERARWIKAIGTLAVVWAICVHSGTGGIFGFVSAKELYHSPLTPPSFVAAALSSGTALIIILLLLTFKCTKRYLDPQLIVGLSKLLVAFILVVLYLIIVENLTRLYAPATYEATQFLLFSGNEYCLVFWIGLILIGSIIPAIILFNPKTKDSISWIISASVCVVIGVLCERFIIVIPGQVYPLELFPGYEVSSPFMDGAIGSYFISPLEVTQAVGVLAIVGILYVLGLKLFALLPTEAKIGMREKR
ncbi:MAG: NrfD/PsrC family molybdoenzyme membrane anchor subunit [Nitrospirota bacterium]